jgi:hypothetical protein
MPRCTGAFPGTPLLLRYARLYALLRTALRQTPRGRLRRVGKGCVGKVARRFLQEVISAETQLGLQCAYLWPWIPASEPE